MTGDGLRKETEIKLRVDGRLAVRLDRLNLKPHEEVDEYFFAREDVRKNSFLRLRSKRGKRFLELKAITAEDTKKNIYEADEIETELSGEQYEKTRRIFRKVFPVTFVVKKTRSTGRLKGCELCYDRVDGLGDYLEIEGPRKMILEICKDLDIDIERSIDREHGYARMTLKRMGLI